MATTTGTDAMSALVTLQAPSDETVATLVPGLSAEDLAEMRRGFHEKLEDMKKEIDDGRKMVKTVEIPLRGYFVGASKLGEGGYPSTLYFVISDFPDPERTGGVVDTRNKDMKARDKKEEVNFDEDRVWTLEEAIAHGRDEEGIIRKVQIDFGPFQFLSLGNEPQLKSVEPGTEATVKIELSAWHDKESFKISARHKIVSITNTSVCPPEMLAMAIFMAGKYTSKFRTEVCYYRKYMADNLATMSDREKLSARYRDRTFIIPIGFEQYMGLMFTRANGMVVYDNTDITTKLKENFVDARPGFNKPRFLCELIVESWDGPSYKEAKANGTIMRCMVNVPMYESLFAGLDWADMTAFQNIFPYLRQGWRMMVICTEDAEKTLMSKLTQSRLSDVTDYDDMEVLNRPMPDGGLSFTLSTMVRGILASPADFLRTVGVPASAEAIKKYLWRGKTIPLPAPDVNNKVLDANKPIICLSEISGDVSVILNDPKREFRVLVPIQSASIGHLGEIGQLSEADGSLFLGYIKECVAAKKGSALTKAQFLKNAGQANLPADHFVLKHDFTGATPSPMFYVFAIDRTHYAAQRDAFLDKFRASSSGFLKDVAGLIKTAPGFAALPAPTAAKQTLAQREEAPAAKRSRVLLPPPPPSVDQMEIEEEHNPPAPAEPEEEEEEY